MSVQQRKNISFLPSKFGSCCRVGDTSPVRDDNISLPVSHIEQHLGACLASLRSLLAFLDRKNISTCRSATLERILGCDMREWRWIADEGDDGEKPWSTPMAVA